MSFPQIISVTASSQVTAEDPITNVTVPAGLKGDRILILIGIWQDRNGIDNPAGWTEILDDLQYCAVYEKILDADASATTQNFDSTGANTMSWVAHAFLIRYSDTSIACQVSTVGTTTTSNPDPPSLTPTGGAKDWLWIAHAQHQHFLGTDRNFSTYPSNYTHTGITTDIQPGSGELEMTEAWRQLNATSEDPGSFALSGAAQTVRTYTLAIPGSYSLPFSQKNRNLRRSQHRR